MPASAQAVAVAQPKIPREEKGTHVIRFYTRDREIANARIAWSPQFRE